MRDQKVHPNNSGTHSHRYSKTLAVSTLYTGNAFKCKYSDFKNQYSLIRYCFKALGFLFAYPPFGRGLRYKSFLDRLGFLAIKASTTDLASAFAYSWLKSALGPSLITSPTDHSTRKRNWKARREQRKANNTERRLKRCKYRSHYTLECLPVMGS